MTLRALTHLLAAIVLFTVTPTAAGAQWYLSLAVESDRFWGGSLESAPEGRSFRPYRPTVFGAALERRQGRMGWGLRARYTEASLALEGEEALVAAKGAFTVVGIAPALSYQLATLGSGNRLLLHVGPLLEFWHPIDQEWRTKVGAQGSVSLAVPLGERFGLTIGGTLAVISSPFHQDELLDQYDLRALWRRGFAAGLEYQL